MQRRRDTEPEMALRRELHSRGLRYRVQVEVTGLPRRTIDIAFTGRRVAVFVDGCFWHRCPVHATFPRANAQWWRDKLDGNVERDRKTDAALRDLGWVVVRVWEHEDAVEAADRVILTLKGAVSG